MEEEILTKCGGGNDNCVHWNGYEWLCNDS